MIGHRATSRRYRTYSYICSTYSNRGSSVCANNLGLPMPAADRAILEQLRDHVLDPDLIEGAIADALTELTPSADAIDTARDRLRRELHEVSQEQERLIDAIATVGDVTALAVALKERETRRAQIAREIARLDDRREVSRIDPRQIERDLRKRTAEMRRLLGQHTPITRHCCEALRRANYLDAEAAREVLRIRW